MCVCVCVHPLHQGGAGSACGAARLAGRLGVAVDSERAVRGDDDDAEGRAEHREVDGHIDEVRQDGDKDQRHGRQGEECLLAHDE